MAPYLAAHPFVLKAAYAGLCSLGGAVVVDLKLFLKDSSWSQFLNDWKPSIASYRYLQGFVGGVMASLTASGVVAIFS